MMVEKMSLDTRKELLSNIKQRYKLGSWHEKCQLLNEFIAITCYKRKYAIKLLNQDKDNSDVKILRHHTPKKYDEATRQALLLLWYAANQICSKRLVPFIPALIEALERHGHLNITPQIRNRLLEISAATVDRLLTSERTLNNKKRGICTTRSGSLLKHQIKVRTFADWDNVTPGFFEGDLVAHCGDQIGGSFLNTLVLTDIASTWTEFVPLLFKAGASVIAAIKVVQAMLPFSFVGLDTDNGCEFINYALLGYCETEKITFTRSRAYRKNDQAHVEERNGSIVRRVIGYDRYEGITAYNALTDLYAVLRLYVNFFQPSLKLLSKERIEAKVTKKYDKAKTPYQRLLLSEHVTAEHKEILMAQYKDLDPVWLLNKLKRLQEHFHKHAWKAQDNSTNIPENKQIPNCLVPHTEHLPRCADSGVIVVNEEPKSSKEEIIIGSEVLRRYQRTNKPRKQLGPRTWRTKKDPFAEIWGDILIMLSINPERTAKSILNDLCSNNPTLNINLLRTLHRRINVWRTQQLKLFQENELALVPYQVNAIQQFIALTNKASVG